MFNWFKKKKAAVHTYFPAQTIKFEALIIPDGWIVIEMGQSLAYALWFCHIVHGDDLLKKVKEPRRVWVEEEDTPYDALRKCIEGIKALEDKEQTMDSLLKDLED